METHKSGEWTSSRERGESLLSITNWSMKLDITGTEGVKTEIKVDKGKYFRNKKGEIK